MKKILLALALCLLPAVASAQCTGVFAAGRVCGSLLGGVPQPVPFTSFGPGASANANTVFAGPTSGPATPAAFRALVGADLPLPTAITLGAVFSKTAVASNWLRSLGTDGIFTASQPSFADLSGSITLAQLPTQAADTALGNWSGGTAVPSATAIPNCSGALNYSTSTHTFSCNTSSIPAAPDQIANCSLAATVAGGALTVSLKDQTGAAPSSLSPCTVAFRDPTIATGTYTSISVTSAVTFATGATGSTFGSTNSTPFRLWITAWNNAGTLVLGVSNQSNSVTIFPINEGNVATSTACSACTNATSAGVYYTTAAQTSKAIRILGYMDWSAGLATAGTYASGPTTIQMFGQGIKKPGDVVQTISASTTTTGSTASATFAALSSPSSAIITPTATPNLIRALAIGTINNTNAGNSFLQFQRATTLIGNPAEWQIGASGNNTGPISLIVYDPVQTPLAATTYSFQGKTSAGTLNYPAASTGSLIELQEIQG